MAFSAFQKKKKKKSFSHTIWPHQILLHLLRQEKHHGFLNVFSTLLCQRLVVNTHRQCSSGKHSQVGRWVAEEGDGAPALGAAAPDPKGTRKRRCGDWNSPRSTGRGLPCPRGGWRVRGIGVPGPVVHRSPLTFAPPGKELPAAGLNSAPGWQRPEAPPCLPFRPRTGGALWAATPGPGPPRKRSPGERTYQLSCPRSSVPLCLLRTRPEPARGGEPGPSAPRAPRKPGPAGPSARRGACVCVARPCRTLGGDWGRARSPGPGEPEGRADFRLGYQGLPPPLHVPGINRGRGFFTIAAV